MFFQFGFYALLGGGKHFRRYDKVFGGIKHKLVHIFADFAAYRVEAFYFYHFFPVKLYAVCFVHIGREDFHNVAPYAEIAALEYGIVPFVLQRYKFLGKLVGRQNFSLFDVNAHIAVNLGHTQTVNARNGRHNDNVAPLDKGVSRA